MRRPAPGLPLAQHIADLWPLLERKAARPPRWSSLLPLPYPYLVPGGRFTEIYYWDSYFTMLGFGPAEEPLRRSMVRNFAYMIGAYGHVPNGNRTYYLSRSQPPLFFAMVALTQPSDPGAAFAKYLPALKREYAYWMAGADKLRPGTAAARVVRLPDGTILNRYWDDRAVPRDEAYRHDVLLARARHRATRQFYRDIRATAESGWDFSSRWFADKRSIATIRTTATVPVDLNSILYGIETAIRDGCKTVRDSACRRTFTARAAARHSAVLRYLWNGKRDVFDDYVWAARRPAGNISAAMLYPLFFHLATAAQAHAVARTVARKLLKSGGLATSDTKTGEQWDAPNGWAPLQWIAVIGLRNYGEDALASTIARRWLSTVWRIYGSSGKLLEKYNVETQERGGGGEYPTQDGFGWTNGVTFALLCLYGRTARAECRKSPAMVLAHASRSSN